MVSTYLLHVQVAQFIPAIEPEIAHMAAEDNTRFAYENEEIGHIRDVSKGLNVKVSLLVTGARGVAHQCITAATTTIP